MISDSFLCTETKTDRQTDEGYLSLGLRHITDRNKTCLYPNFVSKAQLCVPIVHCTYHIITYSSGYLPTFSLCCLELM